MTSDLESTGYETRPRRRRWPRILLGVILAVVATSQVYRWVMHQQVLGEFRKLRQAGYPTNVRELQSWRPAIPPAQNAALRLLEAADYLTLAPDTFRREDWPARNEELGPDERDEFKQIISDNAPALELVHSAATLKQSAFPIDFSRGPATLLPHLAKVKSMSQLLRAEAMLQSEEGDVERAVQSILHSVALGRSLDTEPILISQLVRIACLSISCSSLERVLTQHPLSEAQLDALQTALSDARKASDKAFQSGFFGEIGLGTYCFESRPGELKDVFAGNSEQSSVIPAALSLYRWSGLLDRDFLFYLRTMRQMVEMAETPFPEKLPKARAVGEQISGTLKARRFLFLSGMLLPALEKTIDKAAELEARLRSAEMALLVEKARLKAGGNLPEALPAPVLADPFTAAPLRYHKLDPGYSVYSVGADGVDDGGAELALPRSGARKWPPVRGGQSNPAETGSRESGPAKGKAADVGFTVER